MNEQKFDPADLLEVRIQIGLKGKKYWFLDAKVSRKPKLKGKIIGLLVVLLSCHLKDIKLTGPYTVGKEKNDVGA